MVTKEQYLEAVCKVAHVDDIGDVSDGYHTFNQLYYQRMILFAAFVKQNRDKAWKSLRHEDGELCFGGGWFIVGIDTPEGGYTYHYEDKYFDLFDCETLNHGKHWDGHTEKDVTRLLSLQQEPVFYPPCQDCSTKMDEIRRAYDKLKDQESFDENVIDKIKADITNHLQIMDICDVEKVNGVIVQSELANRKVVLYDSVMQILDKYKAEGDEI